MEGSTQQFSYTVVLPEVEHSSGKGCFYVLPFLNLLNVCFIVSSGHDLVEDWRLARVVEVPRGVADFPLGWSSGWGKWKI